LVPAVAEALGLGLAEVFAAGPGLGEGVVLWFIASYRGCEGVEKKREDISFESRKLE
jgi:hypothetical protein